jgi:methylenetetrahydrofolate reductase (NADPH)
MGVKRLVALRGDLTGKVNAGDFEFASDLVAFIRAQTGDHFHIEVACYPEIHPEAQSPQADIAALLAKQHAGADSAITQYFYNSDAYFRLIDDLDAAGVNLPVVPGILPITNSAQLLHFSQVCGAEIPRWIRLRLQSYGDDLESHPFDSKLRSLSLQKSQGRLLRFQQVFHRGQLLERLPRLSQ